jgi:hypothetical protein
MSSTEAVPFQSPPSLSVDIALPNRGTVSGMGIRKGVTLVVGGGFHGKTTLLKAVEAGVYNKVWTVYPRGSAVIHLDLPEDDCCLLTCQAPIGGETANTLTCLYHDFLQNGKLLVTVFPVSGMSRQCLNHRRLPCHKYY